MLLGPPRIVSPPSDDVIIDGDSASFVCEAIAFPSHEVNWTFTSGSDGVERMVIGTNVSEDTDKYSIVSDREGMFGSLTISDVQYEDRGTYKCTAYNTIGNVSASAVLTVHGMFLDAAVYDIMFACFYLLQLLL